MFSIGEGAGGVVANDTQSSVASLDAALASQARMCATIIEAAGASRLPIGATQKLLEALTNGLSGLASSRADLSAAVRELTVIQGRSNLRETDFGCPVGPESFVFMQDQRHAAKTKA